MPETGGALARLHWRSMSHWTLFTCPWSGDQQGIKSWRRRNGCAWQQAGWFAGANGEAGASFAGREQLLFRPTDTPVLADSWAMQTYLKAGEKVDGLASNNLWNVSDDTLMIVSRVWQLPQRLSQSHQCPPARNHRWPRLRRVQRHHGGTKMAAGLDTVPPTGRRTFYAEWVRRTLTWAW